MKLFRLRFANRYFPASICVHAHDWHLLSWFNWLFLPKFRLWLPGWWRACEDLEILSGRSNPCYTVRHAVWHTYAWPYIHTQSVCMCLIFPKSSTYNSWTSPAYKNESHFSASQVFLLSESNSWHGKRWDEMHEIGKWRNEISCGCRWFSCSYNSLVN